MGQKILGETAYARLQDIPISVDIVNVFRLSEFLPGVARDFIETDAKIFFGAAGTSKSRSGRDFAGGRSQSYRHEPLYQARVQSFGEGD